MSEWLSTPAGVSATVALLSALGGLIYWMGKVQEHKGAVTVFMKEIRDDIKKIFDRLPGTPNPVSGASPLRLTDFGEKIAKSMNAKAWAEQMAPALSDEVRGKASFEIDEVAQNYVNNKLDEDWNRRVSESAYEFGTSRDGILRVLQVLLRNELIKRGTRHVQS